MKILDERKKKSTADTYDVAGTAYVQSDDILALVKQVAVDVGSADLSSRFIVKPNGPDAVSVVCHTVEMMLSDPQKMREAERQADERFKNFTKKLKSAFSKAGGGKLTFKEKKAARTQSVHHVNLNGRFYLLTQRLYEIA